jgi:hypothetical protein
MITTFEEDSKSPDTPADSPIDRESMSIDNLLLMDAMNIDMGVLLAQDDLDDWEDAPDLEYDDEDEDGAETDEQGLRDRWGLDHPHLIRLWRSFKSAGKYQKEIIKFLLWHEAQEKSSEADLIENMVSYFEHSSLLKLCLLSRLRPLLH